MTETSRSDVPTKLDPEDLQLRGSPRRVVRFRRGVIIAVAALGSGAIFGVTLMALQGPALRIKEQVEELYNTERKPTAEGPAALPTDYSRSSPIRRYSDRPCLEISGAPSSNVNASSASRRGRRSPRKSSGSPSRRFRRESRKSSSGLRTGCKRRTPPGTTRIYSCRWSHRSDSSTPGRHALPWRRRKATRTISSASWIS